MIIAKKNAELGFWLLEIEKKIYKFKSILTSNSLNAIWYNSKAAGDTSFS